MTAAHAAGPAWAATAPRRRSEILRACFELMLERKDMLAELISLENGKALSDAKGEVAYAAEFFRWFSEEAVRLNGDISIAPGGANRILVEHQPIGVAVLVTPWNFPAAMATRKIAPALAAGCTVVLKPATETPLTAYALAALYAEAGVPDGVVNVLTTSRSGATVSAMLHDPRVRKLSFTGSTEVGRKLLREAADTVISCSMELGGNAPFIVFDDADIDAAIEGAMIAKMRNGGEACTAANRFYVQEGILDAFASRFAERMGGLKVDVGYDSATQCGPLINADAVSRVDGLVGDAVKRGATVLTGGKPLDREGFYYPPTVLSRRSGRCGDHPGGDLRPGRADLLVQDRGRGDPARQRLRIRPDLVCLHGRSRQGPARLSPSSRAGWSASIGVSYPTPPPPSAARSRAASAVRVRTTASSNSARPSTWP